ncbi:DEAD/DEAH box helicase, partial [Paenibacillus apiarius]|nr:DEAD/DEAH box helicase [Paenibacillus apiarius]
MTTFAESSTSPSVDSTPDTIDFASLGLPRQVVEVLARQGITTPFEIQRATLPDSLAGRDVLGRGQT